MNEFGRAKKITRTAQQELPGVNLEGQERLYAPFRMIDPACGSGHFLLGSFRRILDRWQRNEPGASIRELVQRTLDSIHGVDINPYAVAIARFRLLLVAMKACGVTRLADAPAFHFNLVCGDSLLHAPLRVSATEGQRVLDFELTSDDAECEHAYQSEDLPALSKSSGRAISCSGGQPALYRAARSAAQRALPASVRQLPSAVFAGRCLHGTDFSSGRPPTAFTGQITANSFMKREFGKKLIEQFLPKIDLTHVIDTSGAYIPGHGTPTVILLGRNRTPVASTLRSVLGIRGEPETPRDPVQGSAWSAIVAQVDHPGSRSEFVKRR